MKAHFAKDENGKIWLHFVKDLVVRKIYYEPGFIITKELDYMTKNGRDQLEAEVEEYQTKQSRRSQSMTKKMDRMIGSYYDKVIYENNLYPSTDTSQESENERAINILRPQSAVNFKQHLKTHKID